MGSTVTITFHGAVALVPTVDGLTMRMLLGRFGPVPGVKPQVAYVRFPTSSFHPELNSRTLSAPPPATAGAAAGDAHVVLDGELLSIDGAVDRRLELNTAKDRISQTPVSSDLKSLYWLPHIDRITPGAGMIDPALIVKPISANTLPGLAARLDVTAGRLQTDGAIPDQVTFVAPSGARTEQSIARAAVLTLHLEGNALTLKSE